jgi:hypothetical protein
MGLHQEKSKREIINALESEGQAKGGSNAAQAKDGFVKLVIIPLFHLEVGFANA